MTVNIATRREIEKRLRAVPDRPPLGVTHVAGFICREEWDIMSAICDRAFGKARIWKVFGMYGMTKGEVLFVAKLKGAIKQHEADRLRELHAVANETIKLLESEP